MLLMRIVQQDHWLFNEQHYRYVGTRLSNWFISDPPSSWQHLGAEFNNPLSYYYMYLLTAGAIVKALTESCKTCAPRLDHVFPHIRWGKRSSLPLGHCNESPSNLDGWSLYLLEAQGSYNKHQQIDCELRSRVFYEALHRPCSSCNGVKFWRNTFYYCWFPIVCV